MSRLPGEMKRNLDGSDNALLQVTALADGTVSGRAIGPLARLLVSGDNIGCDYPQEVTAGDPW